MQKSTVAIFIMIFGFIWAQPGLQTNQTQPQPQPVSQIQTQINQTVPAPQVVLAPLVNTTRCGSNWGDANTNCYTLCRNDQDCSTGSSCFAQLSLTPCLSTTPPNPPVNPNTTRCGISWGDANSKCGNFCVTKNDCNGPSENCFADLQLTPCDPAPPYSPIRCGLNWQDAADHCYATCVGDGDCTSLQHCYNSLVVTPCRPQGALNSATSMCGQSAADASVGCMKCINDLDCNSPQTCQPNVICAADLVKVTAGAIGGIVAGVVVFIIVVIVLGVYLWKKHGKQIQPGTPLPPDLAWSFQLASKGSQTNGLFMKPILPDNPDWNIVTNLFYQSLEGGELKISEMLAVYSPSLLTSFRLYKENMEKRLLHNQNLFVRSTWVVNDINGLRQWVMDRYNMKVKQYSWNDQQCMPILPMVHGTSYSAAMSICATGFANISCLDAGWYGKGIYFSSSATYCTPYFASTKNPAVIITYVLPGNPYPVIEHHNAESNLVGSALKTGYQSHYVCTTSQGLPVTEPTNNCFDELVIMQEAQVVPAFVLKIDTSNLMAIMKKFEREVTVPYGEATRFKDVQVVVN